MFQSLSVWMLINQEFDSTWSVFWTHLECRLSPRTMTYCLGPWRPVSDEGDDNGSHVSQHPHQAHFAAITKGV